MTVNGVSNIVAFLPSRNGNTPGTSVLTVPLKKGSANVINFKAYNGRFGNWDEYLHIALLDHSYILGILDPARCRIASDRFRRA